MDIKAFYNKNQKGADCQLVSALNSSVYLHKRALVKPGSKEYDRLIKLTGCIAGSCIDVKKSFRTLKIKIYKKYNSSYNIDFSDLPLMLNVWEVHYGYHAVCVIDYIPYCRAVQVLNLKYKTTTDGWIFLEDLTYFIDRFSNMKPIAVSFKATK